MIKRFFIIITFALLVFMVYVCINTNYSTPTEKNKINKTDTANALTNDTLNEPQIDSLLILLDALKTDSVLKHASVAYVFYNMTQDSLIAEHNPYLSLVPASTMKLFTSAAAFEILGPNTHFKTTLSYNGKIENNVLNGNIIITGGGDPALGSAVYNQAGFIYTFIKAIKDLNIDSINGSIIADPRIFSMDVVPYTWSFGEVNASYAGAANGLTVYDNTYLYELNQNDKGLIIPNAKNLKPKVPITGFYNNFFLTSDIKESLLITNTQGSSKRIIKGGFPKSIPKILIEGTIPDPPYLVAFELFEKLLLNEINISGSPKTVYDIETSELKMLDADVKKQIAVIYSPSVLSIVQNVNMFSNNLFAEHLLKHIGLKKYGLGDTETGVNAVVNFWKQKGLDTEGLFMYDGCGLSRFNALTAKQLTDILRYMKTSPHFNDFYNSLSNAGRIGTLKKLCVGSNAQEQIFAKSGTMSRVKSYAGYAKTLKNDTIVFSIIANNFTCPLSEMKGKFENIMIKMVELGSKPDTLQSVK